jgi:hypothetical protein
MRILGDILGKFLIQIVFKITLVLFISLNVIQLIGNTLVGNIFGLLEHLKERRER